MNFFPCSLIAEQRLVALLRDHKDQLPKIDLCNCDVLVIASDSPIQSWINQYPFSSSISMNLASAWRRLEIEPEFSNEYRQAEDFINKIGNGIPFIFPSKSRFVYRFINCKENHKYFILLPDYPHESFPIVELLNLVNLIQIQKKKIPMHAGAIVNKGRLFLFGGQSGAGKSTVCEFSKLLGHDVLDEDQVLISNPSLKKYVAQSWGNSLKTEISPLTAIFQLIKDSVNRINSLSTVQTAQFLTERNLDIMGYMFDAGTLNTVFCFASEIARNVPGYELHFRKSPDFWKLIDAEFGLD